MQLMRDTTNAFLGTDAQIYPMNPGQASPPVGPTALAAWGASIAETTALTPGTAVAFDRSAVTLRTDNGIKVAWGQQGDDFQRNAVRARVEGRFGVQVSKPLSVVRVDVSAA